ncbi:Metallo-dependent hydrolase [Gonapodya prolifera JEL478]|uniref:Metallo-dependent hydrolase n=1 Tax=Gonapodya prolifera (strain JEL478) TaxID=1344416 RepID=A0A139A332_GONPJ|nr:Metallo-dependent hydrolase [Gonapodya prolifera JEL478]|eukprot:KXS11217.1 Metallo-dependent hydrolase [Gonapodya prolifera JEL478]
MEENSVDVAEGQNVRDVANPLESEESFISREYGSSNELDSFCWNLPKAVSELELIAFDSQKCVSSRSLQELHAHRNGLISVGDMQDLAQRKVKTHPHLINEPLPTIRPDFVIEDFFPFFHFIYQLTDDVESVRYVARRVFAEFARDGVRYLEIRSTPRDNATSGMSKEDYMRAVVHVIKEVTNLHPPITIRFIPSTDSHSQPADALATVSLALRLLSEPTIGSYLVGLDVCGDPTRGSADNFRSSLETLRAANPPMKTTVHIGEVPTQGDEGWDVVTTIGPNRIGHGTYLQKRTKDSLVEQKIPSELDMHDVQRDMQGTFPIGHWFAINHPVVLCSDDPGIFSCPLSYEYAQAARAFRLGKRELFELSRRGFECAFVDERVKEGLREYWNQWAKGQGLI